MKNIKLYEEFLHEGNDNRLAYDGLKKVGHNFASKPFDPKLDYTTEWEEEKQNPDNFDDFSDEERIKFGIDEKETGAYAAPKFAIRPAAGDTGYAYVAKQFGATPGPKRKKGSKTQEVDEKD